MKKVIQRKEHTLPPTYIHQVLSEETKKQLNKLKIELIKDEVACTSEG